MCARKEEARRAQASRRRSVPHPHRCWRPQRAPRQGLAAPPSALDVVTKCAAGAARREFCDPDVRLALTLVLGGFDLCLLEQLESYTYSSITSFFVGGSIMSLGCHKDRMA